MKLMLTWHGGAWWLRVTDGTPEWDGDEWHTRHPTKMCVTQVSGSFVRTLCSGLLSDKTSCLTMELGDTVTEVRPPQYYVRPGEDRVRNRAGVALSPQEICRRLNDAKG